MQPHLICTARASCCPGHSLGCDCPLRGAEDSELCLAPSGDMKAENLGAAPGKSSTSILSYCLGVLVSSDCCGEPGLVLLSLSEGGLRDQCTAILSQSWPCSSSTSHASEPTSSSLCIYPSLLSPCLLGDSAVWQFQRCLQDYSQSILSQDMDLPAQVL